jgi:hypothetical protein
MFPIWIIYIILTIIIISLGIYYNKMNEQKSFLEENFDPKFENNSVLKNYHIYKGSYNNIVDRNNNLENRLANNNYGSYYNTLYTNFSNLNAATGRLANNINNRSMELNNNINNFKNTLANDANFINNNKNNIIQKYNGVVNTNLTVSNTPTIPNGFTVITLNTNPGNMVQYRSGYQTTIFKITIWGLWWGGTVWGTDLYTDDSNISMAAIHAGVLGLNQIGDVFIQMVGPRSSYTGTNRNSIQTFNYGSWPGTYQFLRPSDNFNNTINNTINRQLEPSVSSYISGLPSNQQINNTINDIYNQGINTANSQINGMSITLQQALR